MPKRKPSKKSPTLKEEYYRKRNYYEKKLNALESNNYYVIDKNKNPTFEPLSSILPKIPKNITRASIKALEKAYKQRNKKLVVQTEQGDLISATVYAERMREIAGKKGYITRQINQLEKEIKEKANQLIEEEKKKTMFENIFDEEDNKTIDDYSIDDEDQYIYTSDDEDTFDREKWYKEHEEKAQEEAESETEYDLYEIDSIVDNALETLRNWVVPYYYSDEMIKTQSARILDAIKSLLSFNNLPDSKKAEYAQKIEDNANSIQHSVDILTMSYEEDENMAALENLLDIFGQIEDERPYSLEESIGMNDWYDSVVGF